MKSKNLPLGLATSILFYAISSVLPGAALSWDTDTGTAGNQGGAGTWNLATTNWLNAGTNVAWTQTSATASLNTATFGGGVDGAPNDFDITLGTNLAAQTLTFSNTGYRLTAASATTLILTNTGNGLVSVAGGKSATIGNNASVNINAASNTGTRVDLLAGSTLRVASGGTLTRSGGLVSGGSTTGGTLGFTGSGTLDVEGTLSYQVTTPHTNGGIILSFNNGNNNVLNVNGGTVSSNSNVNGIALVYGGGGAMSGTSGTLNVNSGLVSTTGTAAATAGINLANGAGGTGTVNLNGGTISTFRINSNWYNSSNVLTTGGTSIFNFHGGTLKSIANNAAFMGGLTSAFVKANGAIIDSNGFNITITQPLLADTISPGGGLAKNGAGNLTLSGASTYTGTTSINAGTLSLNGSLTSSINLAPGAAVAGTGSTTGSLTTNAGSSLLGNAGGGILTVSGGVNFSGATTLDFDAPLTSGNTYDIVNYGAGGVSNLSNLAVTSRGTINNDVPNTKLTFTAGAVDTRTWNVNSGTWEVGGTNNNWVEGDQKFYNGDSVVFNNPASLSTVTLSGSLFPQSVSVTNTNGYIFSGSGSISGTAGLDKQGGGTLEISTANTYAGITSIQAGTLLVSGSLGNTSIQISPGAILQTTSSGSISGSASLSIDGSAILASAASFTGGTSINTGGVLQLGDGSTDGSVSTTSSIFNDGSLVFNNGAALTFGKAIAGSGSVTKQGAGTLTLTVANSYGGGTQITGGALTLSGAGTLGTGAINVGSAGSLNLGNLQAIGVAVTGAGNISHNGGGQVSITGDVSGFTGTYTHNSSAYSSAFNASAATSAGAAYVIAAPQGSQQGIVAAADGDYTLQMGSLSGVANSLLRGGNFATGTTTCEIGALNTNTTFSGIIANGATKVIALKKVGSGTLTLEGVNTYTGTTTVTSGVLVLTQDDVLNDASTLDLASASSLNLTHSGIDRVGSLIINGAPQIDGLYTFGTGKIQVGNGTPFQLWAVAKDLDGTPGKENGLGDDPDNDGATNLEEFAFNGDPLSGSDSGIVSVFTADTSNPGADKELVLTLSVRAGAPAFSGSPSPTSAVDGITYSVEGGVDLSAFITSVSIVTPITTGLPDLTGSGYEYRSFSLDGSAGLSGKGFLRAKADAP